MQTKLICKKCWRRMSEHIDGKCPVLLVPAPPEGARDRLAEAAGLLIEKCIRDGRWSQGYARKYNKSRKALADWLREVDRICKEAIREVAGE